MDTWLLSFFPPRAARVLPLDVMYESANGNDSIAQCSLFDTSAQEVLDMHHAQLSCSMRVQHCACLVYCSVSARAFRGGILAWPSFPIGKGVLKHHASRICPGLRSGLCLILHRCATMCQGTMEKETRMEKERQI